MAPPPQPQAQNMPAAPTYGGAPTQAAPPPPPSGHSSGSINLSKGGSINLTKRAGTKFIATCEWPPATDYDVYALVLYRDGHTEVVSTFGTERDPRGFSLTSSDGSVRHMGDVRRGGGPMASESIEIELNDQVHAVVPVVYSAQSNGTGSFQQYQVSMVIDNGAGAQVRIDAKNANSNNNVYSCVPGIIVNGNGVAEVRALEQYSKPSSENRPLLQGDLTVIMDSGPRNAYK